MSKRLIACGVMNRGGKIVLERNAIDLNGMKETYALINTVTGVEFYNPTYTKASGEPYLRDVEDDIMLQSEIDMNTGAYLFKYDRMAKQPDKYQDEMILWDATQERYTLIPEDTKWQQIPGFDGYWISNTGLIMDMKREELVHPYKNHKGVICVKLYRDRHDVGRSVEAIRRMVVWDKEE